MQGFAERLKGLIEDHEGGDIPAAAQRLGWDETELVLVLYGPPATPPMRLFRAVVREYCADPGWLLTGSYDPSELGLDLQRYAQVVDYLFRYTEGADTPPEEHPRLDVVPDEPSAGLGDARAAGA